MASPALVSNHSDAGLSLMRSRALILILAFAATLPLINPLVHGDGVGYYAYLRAPLIQHNLDFEQDWRRANPGFAQARMGPGNQISLDNYTSTGRIGNLFTVGPAILWSPFFLLAHAAVLIANGLGANIPADGFSFPYRVLTAFGTAVYGFLGLLLSYTLARKYFNPAWALLATVAIWAGSALPVYMYFNPFWSHAHSAFIVSLFLWYWDRTRPDRTIGQWLLLGIISGLLVDVYFVNGVFLLLPLAEAIQGYIQSAQAGDGALALRQFGSHAFYFLIFLLTVLPTLITRKIIFGGIFRFGAYSAMTWQWRAPFLRSVLFSADHGVVSWTPLLGLALIGLLIPYAPAKRIQGYLLLAFLVFLYVISCYPYWDGLASYGNRFFISLTPVFIFGLTNLMERLAGYFRTFRAAYGAQAAAVAALVVWNLAFIFQWGIHLVPARGEISWSGMMRNQFVEVPQRITQTVASYFTHRGELMQHIEQEDIEQQKLPPKRGD